MQTLVTGKIEHLKEQLPETELLYRGPVYAENHYKGDNYHIYEETGRCIGALLLDNVMQYTGFGVKYIKRVHIDEGYQGQGYGKATYLNLIEQLQDEDQKLRSGITLSRSSKPIWDWLVRHELAVILADRGVDESAQHFHYSYTKYQTI